MAEVLADFDTAHCGTIHDTQLDSYGQCLATASADGHVRLWDVRKPQEPTFLADLGSHAGPVHQVAWEEVGVLLASVGGDGCVLVWGRRLEPGSWHVVHREPLEQHGAVRAVAWAPAEHGAVIACASADGTVTVITHSGPLRGTGGAIEHRWQGKAFQAHRGEARAVSWASAPALSDQDFGLVGAQLATAGDDGVAVWCWNQAKGLWTQDAVDSASASGSVVRDVAWKPWDGVTEVLATAGGQHVQIWRRTGERPSAVAVGSVAAAVGGGRWCVAQRIFVGADVWKVTWADGGAMLLVSWGLDDARASVLKERLDGDWDVMDVEGAGDGGVARAN
eukprot:CAMPEP_0117605706 /NCGR_PEP_ID=MMETSP0784-20121206/79332_1 /TAXON_ID=39447 /ORGANISM="" /LENGTH=334 /DNA_ID=CAMNT_0005408759 /DNA_START=105 /DNA_END=1109 /DNA_ORIENTATION=+